MSGCAVHYVKRENRGGDMGPWADMLNPARFFAGPFSDPHGEDIELVGYLHDMSLGIPTHPSSPTSTSRADASFSSVRYYRDLYVTWLRRACIHSFVEELIERQRMVNRLLSLNDRVLSTGL